MGAGGSSEAATAPVAAQPNSFPVDDRNMTPEELAKMKMTAAAQVGSAPSECPMHQETENETKKETQKPQYPSECPMHMAQADKEKDIDPTNMVQSCSMHSVFGTVSYA